MTDNNQLYLQSKLDAAISTHIDYKISFLGDYIQKPPISCILIGGFSVICSKIQSVYEKNQHTNRAYQKV